MSGNRQGPLVSGPWSTAGGPGDLLPTPLPVRRSARCRGPRGTSGSRRTQLGEEETCTWSCSDSICRPAGRPASIRPAALCLRVSQPVSALGDSASRLPRAVLPAPDSLPLPGRGTRRSTRRLLPSANRGGVSPGRPDEGERGGRAGCRRESKAAQRERGTVHRGSPAAWLLKPWGGEERAYAQGDPWG